jgi:LemA protein
MKNKGLWITLGLLFALGGCGVSYYNRLVSAREAVPGAWSQVENVLQRRYDLIPNLINTVKGYAKHEASLLEEVTRLRSQWGEAKTVAGKIESSRQLEGTLARLMVVAEQYPNLKANENFARLQDELAGTENRIAVERRRYNETVQIYNVTLKRFPGNMAAALIGGFSPSDAYFKSEESASKVPVVSFE